MPRNSRFRTIPSRDDIYRERGWRVSGLSLLATRFTWIPLFMIAVILLTLSLMAPIIIVDHLAGTWDLNPVDSFRDVVLLGFVLALSYPVFGLGLLFFGPILKWTMGIFSHQREGDYPYLSPVGGYWSIVNGVILFNRRLFLELCRTTYLIVLFYRFMGMSIGKNAMINSTYLHDPDLVRVGNDVTIGGDAVILGHVGDRGVLKLRKVEIGNGADIGQSSIIMPGCIVGDRSIIGANSLVTTGTVVPPDEVWAGSPARRIARVKSNRQKRKRAVQR